MVVGIVSMPGPVGSMKTIGMEMQWPGLDHVTTPDKLNNRPPRVGHTKSRKGCAQCKRRHVKCNEEKPCSNCVRHGVPCSLAGGPFVPREDAKKRRQSEGSSSTTVSRKMSQDALSNISMNATSRRTTSPQPTPFQLLTGRIDRPATDPAWQLDLQLMYHFMTHTGSMMTEMQDFGATQQIWQLELPKIAFESDCLLHALLGFAALHKAHIEPENAVALRESAVMHLDEALVAYRSETAATTMQNANAKFLFTWIVALFAYAIPPALAPIDAMVELFMLVRSIDVVLSETWFWVSQGPFAPILNRGFQEAVVMHPPESYSLPDGMNFSLDHLDFMLAVDPAIPLDDRNTCARVLGELRQLYDQILRLRNTTSVASILCFPKRDSAAFSQLVKQRSPQALVLLTHYCVLLDVLNTRWWINGWAGRLVNDVLNTLDENWRHWAEWPAQVVLAWESVATGSVAPEYMM